MNDRMSFTGCRNMFFSQVTGTAVNESYRSDRRAIIQNFLRCDTLTICGARCGGVSGGGGLGCWQR